MKTRPAPVVTLIISALLALIIASPASAVQIYADSYDMPNGFRTATYEYADNSYNGTGNLNSSLSPLSGGVGDLTDGFISTQHYGPAESPAGPGPYVGWNISPTIIFHFSSTVNLDYLTLFLDDPVGPLGCSPTGVCLPGSVTLTMGDNTITTPVTDPATAVPFGVTFYTPQFSGDTLTMTLNRKNIGFIFLSEVTFDGSYPEVQRLDSPVAPVPEPGTLVLLGAGLLGLAAYGKRRMARR